MSPGNNLEQGSPQEAIGRAPNSELRTQERVLPSGQPSLTVPISVPASGRTFPTQVRRGGGLESNQKQSCHNNPMHMHTYPNTDDMRQLLDGEHDSRHG